VDTKNVQEYIGDQEKDMRRKRYSREFKLDALRLLETSGKSVAEIERDLGLSTGLLYKWRERYQVVSDGSEELSLEESDEEALRAELRRVKHELEEVKQERDILKKAMAIFSQDQLRNSTSSKNTGRNSQ
jgi:transposase